MYLCCNFGDRNFISTPLSSVVNRFYPKNLEDLNNVMGAEAAWFWVSTIIAAPLFLMLNICWG